MELTELYRKFLASAGVCTDTRKLWPGEIFFALQGPQFDGNQYAAAAIEGGAVMAIVNDPAVVTNAKFVLVEDPLQELQKLAAYHRQQMKVKVIAITGTNGKTTSKELCSRVLDSEYPTLSTTGNLNNHIGVPLTLLKLKPEHKFAVIEMGANHTEEIAFLCELAKPDFGVITNIGKAHLEGFGSEEGIRKAKGEMFDYLRQNEGTAFVNICNEMLQQMAEGISKIITYGTDERATYWGEMAVADPFLTIRYHHPKGAFLLNTQMVGRYNLENIMLALAIGTHFKVKIKKLKSSIENYQPSSNRSQVIEKGSNTFILDAYNANPSSMKAALESFASIKALRKMVVLGDMLELAGASEEEHRQVAAQALRYPFDQVLLVGKEFSTVARDGAKVFSNVEELKDWFSKNTPSNTYILVKGSRGMNLEKLLADQESFS